MHFFLQSMLPGSMESCSDTKFPYIYSKTALMMTGLYRITDYVDKEFTTVQMAVAGTNTLLFLGTDNGHLIQVSILFAGRSISVTDRGSTSLWYNLSPLSFYIFLFLVLFYALLATFSTSHNYKIPGLGSSTVLVLGTCT